MHIIKRAKSLGIVQVSARRRLKRLTFSVNPFMGMFIICELRIVNCELLKCEPKCELAVLLIDQRKSRDTHSSHISTENWYYWDLHLANCLAEVKIYCMYLNVDENEIKSLVSTIPLTYVCTEGGLEIQANGSGQY